MFYWQYFNRFIFNQKRNRPDVSFNIQFWIELFMWILGSSLVIITVYLYTKKIWHVDEVPIVACIMSITIIIMLIIILLTNYQLIEPMLNRAWNKIFA